MKIAKKEQPIINGVNMKHLPVYQQGDIKYVVITDIAVAFGIDRTSVYNASARIGKEAVATYVIKKPTEANGSIKKCINVNGLPLIFNKLHKRIPGNKARGVINYILSCEPIVVEVDSEISVTSNVLEFTPKHTELPESKTIELSKEETIDDTIDGAPVSEPIKNETTNDSLIVDSTNESTEVPIDSGADDILSLLGQITDIITEHGKLKNKVSELESENKLLAEENNTLKAELANVQANPDEVKQLKEELAKCKQDLLDSKKVSNEIAARLSIIKNFTKANNK